MAHRGETAAAELEHLEAELRWAQAERAQLEADTKAFLARRAAADETHEALLQLQADLRALQARVVELDRRSGRGLAAALLWRKRFGRELPFIVARYAHRFTHALKALGA